LVVGRWLKISKQIGRRLTTDSLSDTIHSTDLKESAMSAPSRRPEIRRRRTRKEKILKLRKRHAAAGSETERSPIAAKLSRLARKSPGQPLLKS
jgi:hypothetical protein